MDRKTLEVGDYRITAWQDEDGFLVTEVAGREGQKVIACQHSEREETKTITREVFTVNPNIIADERGDFCLPDGKHYDLRRMVEIARRDSVYARWFTDSELFENFPSELDAKIQMIEAAAGRNEAAPAEAKAVR